MEETDMKSQVPSASASTGPSHLHVHDGDVLLWLTVPEEVQSHQNERRLEPHEWVELLEQTECLEYISPDVDACMDRHHQVTGTQELDLTGREFFDSPVLPPLSEERRATKSAPCDAPRRPGLREKFPRHQQTHFPRNYFVVSERAVDTKRPATRSTTAENRENVAPKSASRTLKFDVAPQPTKTPRRRKRASWNGRSTTQATSRRTCKSARKSKDCSIPGCTKGARSRGLCKRHGGGKRCTFPECTRSDQGGGFCIAHGGGKRCAIEGCKNSAQSRGLCKSHGGGKRCKAEGCTKSTQEGGYCRGHYQMINVAEI